jgi:hypothetical protein
MQPNQVYHVVLQYEDGRLQGWVNDKQVLDHQQVITGRFNDSVALFGMKDADFDNVKVYSKPYTASFNPQPAPTADSNRKATIDAAKYLDASKPDCGLQAAIDALPASGGCVILPKGEIILHHGLFLREGVTIRGQGEATRIGLPSPIVWSQVAAPARPRDTSITLIDASKFKPGYMLCIGMDEMYYLSGSEPFRVKSVSGNTIELTRPLNKAVKEKEPVGNWFPVLYGSDSSDQEVRDLTILGRSQDPAPFNGGYGASAITFMNVRDVRITNVVVQGWKGDALSYQGGRDSFWVNDRIYGATMKGFHPGSCQQRVIMTRGLAEGCSDDGFYFCRYNHFSVMCNNEFNNSGKAMIGGLAAAGDAFNTINNNIGKNNKGGIPIIGGANDVIAGNVVVNSGDKTIMYLSGGQYGPKQSHPYAGPSRYFVIASNTFVGDRSGDDFKIVTAANGAASNLFVNNVFKIGDKTAADLIAFGGPNNLAENNQRGDGKIIPPPALPGIAPMPQPIIDASNTYDPAKPDCGFQNAIDKAAAKGGTVLLPAGFYPLKTALNVPANVTLSGQGLSTVLLWSGPGAAIRAQKANKASVRHLAIRGDGSASNGISLVQSQNVLIEAVTIEGMGQVGVHLDQCPGAYITQAKVRDCADAYVISKCADFAITESMGLFNSNDGIRVTDPAGNLRIEANIFFHNRANAVTITGPGATKISLVSNVIVNTGQDGVSLTDADAAVVKWNVVANSSLVGRGQFAGVALRGSTRNSVVAENRLGDDTFNPFQIVAVRETDKADANTIRHNVACPNNLPPTGRLTGQIATVGKATKAQSNVLLPYNGPPTTQPVAN